MKYIKLKVSFIGYKERLNRVLLVKNNTPLVDLACIILTSFESEFEHQFMFKDSKSSYMLKQMFDGMTPSEKNKLMDDYNILDLNNKFMFIYDFGQDWIFECEYKKEIIDYDVDTDNGESETAILLDGKGQGIWEDNIGTLYAYLNGELNPNDYKENEKKGYFRPSNFENECWGDFDKFNLEHSKNYFSSMVDEDLEAFKENYFVDYDDSYCPKESTDIFVEEGSKKECKNDAYFTDFYNNANELFNYYRCENKAIRDIENNLLKSLDQDIVADILTKSLMLSLYEAGSKKGVFDIEDFKNFVLMFTNDVIM